MPTQFVFFKRAAALLLALLLACTILSVLAPAEEFSVDGVTAPAAVSAEPEAPAVRRSTFLPPASPSMPRAAGTACPSCAGAKRRTSRWC